MRLTAALLAVTIAACTGPSTDPVSLQGLWSSDARSNGGLGSQFSFSSDSRVSQSFGAIVDFKYRVEGNRLVTTFSQDGGEQQETTEEFLINGDTLTLNPHDPQKKQVMTRVGPPMNTDRPIVGTWTYQHYTGVPAFNRYSADGAMQLSVPFKTAEGFYALVNGKLSLKLEGQPSTEVDLNIAGPKLTMKNGKGEYAFTRFDF